MLPPCVFHFIYFKMKVQMHITIMLNFYSHIETMQKPMSVNSGTVNYIPVLMQSSHNNSMEMNKAAILLKLRLGSPNIQNIYLICSRQVIAGN